MFALAKFESPDSFLITSKSDGIRYRGQGKGIWLDARS